MSDENFIAGLVIVCQSIHDFPHYIVGEIKDQYSVLNL